MKSLVLKDIYLFKKNIRTLILPIIIVSMPTIFSNLISNTEISPFSKNIFSSVAIMMIFMTVYNSLSFDDESKFLDYVRAMPLKLEDYVRGKYVFSLIVYVFMFLILMIINVGNMNLTSSIYASLIQCGIMSILGSTVLMLIFKFSIKNISQIIFILYFGLILLYTFGDMTGIVNINIGAMFQSFNPLILVGVLILSVVAYLLMQKLSVKILKANKG